MSERLFTMPQGTLSHKLTFLPHPEGQTIGIDSTRDMQPVKDRNMVAGNAIDRRSWLKVIRDDSDPYTKKPAQTLEAALGGAMLGAGVKGVADLVICHTSPDILSYFGKGIIEGGIIGAGLMVALSVSDVIDKTKQFRRKTLYEK